MCVCECVCVSGNGCPAHMQFIFLLPLLLYRSPDVASTKPASGFGLQLVLLVAVDLPLLLPPPLLYPGTLQLSSSAKQKACCLISARVAKLPSCRAAGESSALPRLATFCRLSCCFMCNIFTTLRRQQQRQVQNALSSDKWHNATTTSNISNSNNNYSNVQQQ